jgi:uncharacterized protein YdbL (DUF1318 family)
MSKRTGLIAAAALSITLLGGGAALAFQQDNSAQLRATGKVGEQADGYLGIVGTATGDLRAQVDAVNIKRRAFYTDLAAKRGAKIEEVAATTACEILATRVQPGQYYRLPGGGWQQRQGSAPVPRPSYCG